MPRAFCPRLAEAPRLLSLFRGHLGATACRYPLPAGIELNLLPIVEDGLFGYELVPDRRTHTYLTIGCDARRHPIVRKTRYDTGAANVLQLVATNGQILPPSARATRHGIQQRDARFHDWFAAAEVAWAQLALLFPERPRQPLVLREHAQRCLDEALSIAHSHLAQWNPCIHFCGLPNEAQQGYVLTGADRASGELLFQRPDIWMLRWRAPPTALYESWSVPAQNTDAAVDLA